MTIYKAYNSVLKVESGGSYVTVAYLTDASIDRSMSDETVTPLFARSVQHTPDESSVMSATLSASGYFSDDANLDLMIDGFSAGDEIGIRLYVDSTTYYEATARITSLSIGGGESGALAVSLSMSLVDVLLIRPYKQLGSRLTASDAGANDLFGEQPAISGNGLVLAVGAYQWDGGGGSDQGGVYIYDWNGTGWTQRGSVLTASDAAATDWFGRSVSLSYDGSVLVVGADKWEGANSGQGGVYIYDRNGTSWTQRGSVLTASDANSFDQFGSSVCISGDGQTLLTGAPLWEGATTDQGAVYVFRRSGTAWTQKQIIYATDPSVAAWFGHSLASNYDATIIAAGAPRASNGGTERGKSYVYRITPNGQYELSDSISAPTPSNSDKFSRLAISDDFLVINGLNSGHCFYRLKNDGTADYLFSQTLPFGTSSAITKNSGILIAGESGDDTAATNAGAVYTYYG